MHWIGAAMPIGRSMHWVCGSSTGGSMHLVCAATGMLGIVMYESFHDSVRGPRTTDGVES